MFRKILGNILPKKNQVLFIHGGESFNTYESYFKSILNSEYDPAKKRKKK